MEKELQIKAQIINGITLKPLADAEAGVILYYLNQSHTVKETYYRKNLNTDAEGRFSTPSIALNIYPDQIYRLRLVLSHPGFYDTEFFQLIELDDTDNTVNYTFALNPKESPLKLRLMVQDVISGKLLDNNHLKFYGAAFDKESRKWNSAKKIIQNTGKETVYELELPGEYSPATLSNRYRYDISVEHTGYTEIAAEKTFINERLSTIQLKYYDFTTLRYDTFMVGDDSLSLLVGFLTNNQGRPLVNQPITFYGGQGSGESAALVHDFSYEKSTDKNGKIVVTIPNSYLYVKDQFVNVVGLIKGQSFSKVYSQLLDRGSDIRVIEKRFAKDINLTLIVQPKEKILMPWTVGLWWRVRFSNRRVKDDSLIFKVVEEAAIDDNLYFEVNVSSVEEPDKVIAQLYYRKRSYTLRLVVFPEDNLNYDFEESSPVVFFEDNPFDFPLLEDFFTKGRPRLANRLTTEDSITVERQRYYEANSLIQTTRNKKSREKQAFSTTLDLTIDQQIFLTTIDWVSSLPWWSSYQKEMIDESTAQAAKQCQARLTGYGYKNHTIYQSK